MVMKVSQCVLSQSERAESLLFSEVCVWVHVERGCVNNFHDKSSFFFSQEKKTSSKPHNKMDLNDRSMADMGSSLHFTLQFSNNLKKSREGF